MPNIFEAKITANNVKTVWEKRKRKPRIGQMFFTPVQQAGLDINLIKGKDDTPVALVAANWDTDVLYRDRIGFQELSAEMPFFKEAYKVSEKLRQQIVTAQDQYRQPFFNQVFRDVENLIEGADVAAERLSMQVLATGTISIQENGVDKQYDYGFKTADQFKNEGTLWSASSAKPLASLVAQIKAYKKLTKKAAKYAIMNSDVAEKLFNDAEVLAHFNALAVPNPYPTDAELQAYVESKTGLTIIIADDEYKKARDFKGNAVPYYPQDRYTLVSTLDLGELVYGTTPEAIDLTSGDSAATSVAVLSNGVTVTTWKEADPVCVSVKVSEVVLPSCPNIDQVYIVKVL